MTRSELTVVLSRSPGDDPDKRRREQEVTAALRDAGYAEVTSVPHLYYLRPDDAVVRALRGSAGDLIVLAWSYPRATEWVLYYDGIRGGADRRVVCFDLRSERDPGELAAEVRRAAGAEVTNASPVAVADADGAPGRRWYPVLDYERCSNCLECIEFCLFGVYGIDDAGHVFVENADGCKTDCPACSRVCPLDAIIFPECPTPLIAGAPEDDVETDEADSVQLGSTVTLTFGGRRDPEPVAAGEDELDRLIDDLEDMNP